jgi:hypothetical protein
VQPQGGCGRSPFGGVGADRHASDG